jgi:hypothetical protein
MENEENRQEQNAPNRSPEEAPFVTETEVIEAFKNGDPNAVEMADKLFGIWQEGCGESLRGGTMFGEMLADFYRKIGDVDAEMRTLNDTLDMLEQEGSDEAKEYFEKLADREGKLRDGLSGN